MPDSNDPDFIDALPLSARSRTLIYLSFLVWLGWTLYEVLHSWLIENLPGIFGEWRDLELAYIVFAAAALFWSGYVVEAAERRRARVLTALLLVIMVSLKVGSRFVLIRLAGSHPLMEDLAWEKLNGLAAVGVLCMWFGATGMTVLMDSLGRLDVSSGPPVKRRRLHVGYWLLAAYLLVAAYQLYHLRLIWLARQRMP